MSGTPTEAEIQDQWKKVVDVLETWRNFADGTMVLGGGKLDVLAQAVEGDFLPTELTRWADGVRALLSSGVTPGNVNAAILPVVLEYRRLLAADAALGFGSGYNDPANAWRAIYEWFKAKGLTVKSRSITYAGAVAGGGNVGNGAMDRLTVDENNFNLEACTVEKKQFRCRQDQNSGVEKQAEVFEVLGAASSFDSLLRASFGSGQSINRTIVSKHAGTTEGGSLLTNSSFSDFNSGSTPKFNNWTEAAGSADVNQDTTNFYRSFPGAQVDASLKITSTGGTTTLTQTIDLTKVRRLDPNTPYFLRIMVNKTIGTAVGGNVVLRLGSKSATISIASLGAGWQELKIALGQSNWFRQFNQDTLTIQIEWNTKTSGYLLVDDAIFCPFDLIDGTYWCLRQNAATPIAWLVDDILTFTDTGGAPATGKIQWWNYVGGWGYLPSTTGTPTMLDP